MSIQMVIVFCVIFGTITAAIAQKKNLPPGRWFVGGALLFIVALPLVILEAPGLPKAPPGMRAMQCPRCNAVQNVDNRQQEYECWQCRGYVGARWEGVW